MQKELVAKFRRLTALARLHRVLVNMARVDVVDVASVPVDARGGLHLVGAWVVRSGGERSASASGAHHSK